MKKNKKMLCLIGSLIVLTFTFTGCTEDSIESDVKINPMIETDSSAEAGDDLITDVIIDDNSPTEDVINDSETEVEDTDVNDGAGVSGKLNIDAIMELNIDKDTYQVGDKLQLSVNNVGDTYSIEVGNPYKLEKIEGETLTEVPLDLMFTMEMTILEPGINFTQEVDLINLEAGSYRISKDVYIENQETESEIPALVTLQKDFVIE